MKDTHQRRRIPRRTAAHVSSRGPTVCRRSQAGYGVLAENRDHSSLRRGTGLRNFGNTQYFFPVEWHLVVSATLGRKMSTS